MYVSCDNIAVRYAVIALKQNQVTVTMPSICIVLVCMILKGRQSSGLCARADLSILCSYSNVSHLLNPNPAFNRRRHVPERAARLYRPVRRPDILAHKLVWHAQHLLLQVLHPGDNQPCSQSPACTGAYSDQCVGHAPLSRPG